MGRTTDKASGVANQAAGKVKEAAGKVIGSTDWKPKALLSRRRARLKSSPVMRNRRLRTQPTRLPVRRIRNSELSGRFWIVAGGGRSCRSELSCSSS